jgi:hypothetical protein
MSLLNLVPFVFSLITASLVLLWSDKPDDRTTKAQVTSCLPCHRVRICQNVPPAYAQPKDSKQVVLLPNLALDVQRQGCCQLKRLPQKNARSLSLGKKSLVQIIITS